MALSHIQQWFDTPLGKKLLNAEVSALHPFLPHIFGYHLLQIGSVGKGQLFQDSRISYRFFITDNPQINVAPPYLYGELDNLPFCPDCMDVVLLPHVMEFADNPHQILREVERVLIPEGYAIILGFNPISLWGLWRWCGTRRKTLPWSGRFLPIFRLQDWLTLLGFRVVETHTFFFDLPFENARLAKYTSLLDTIGNKWMWHLGAVYLLIAQKQVATLTPIKPSWITQQTLVPEVISTPFGTKK